MSPYLGGKKYHVPIFRRDFKSDVNCEPGSGSVYKMHGTEGNPKLAGVIQIKTEPIECKGFFELVDGQHHVRKIKKSCTHSQKPGLG